MSFTRKLSVAFAALGLLALGAARVNAQMDITDPTNQFKVRIRPLGNLSGDNSLGFMRLSDGYDPIRPGSPWEQWGVSAGSVSAWAVLAGQNGSGGGVL